MMAELKVTFDKDQMQEIVDKAVKNIKADIANNILEQIIKDRPVHRRRGRQICRSLAGLHQSDRQVGKEAKG